MTNNLAIHREGPAAVAALEAWLGGSLPANDAEKLRAWVAEASPWRDAYLQMLGDLAGEEALVPRLDAKRSISVAMGDAQLEHAELIDRLPLPHLGPAAHREGRLTAQGHPVARRGSWRARRGRRNQPPLRHRAIALG